MTNSVGMLDLMHAAEVTLSVPSPQTVSDTSAWNYHSMLTLDDGSDRLA